MARRSPFGNLELLWINLLLLFNSNSILTLTCVNSFIEFLFHVINTISFDMIYWYSFCSASNEIWKMHSKLSQTVTCLKILDTYVHIAGFSTLKTWQVLNIFSAILKEFLALPIHHAVLQHNTIFFPVGWSGFFSLSPVHIKPIE